MKNALTRNCCPVSVKSGSAEVRLVEFLELGLCTLFFTRKALHIQRRRTLLYQGQEGGEQGAVRGFTGSSGSSGSSLSPSRGFSDGVHGATPRLPASDYAILGYFAWGSYPGRPCVAPAVSSVHSNVRTVEPTPPNPLIWANLYELIGCLFTRRNHRRRDPPTPSVEAVYQ